MNARHSQGGPPMVLARCTPRGQPKPAPCAPHKWSSSWSFQTWPVLCAESSEHRPRSTPWIPDTPKEYCRLFWHGARLGFRRNLLPVRRTCGLEVGHFRAGLCCVQSDRCADPGARHGYGELTTVDADEHDAAHASWSTVCPQSTMAGTPKTQDSFLR